MKSALVAMFAMSVRYTGASSVKELSYDDATGIITLVDDLAVAGEEIDLSVSETIQDVCSAVQDLIDDSKLTSGWQFSPYGYAMTPLDWTFNLGEVVASEGGFEDISDMIVPAKFVNIMEFASQDIVIAAAGAYDGKRFLPVPVSGRISGELFIDVEFAAPSGGDSITLQLVSASFEIANAKQELSEITDTPYAVIDKGGVKVVQDGDFSTSTSSGVASCVWDGVNDSARYNFQLELEGMEVVKIGPVSNETADEITIKSTTHLSLR